MFFEQPRGGPWPGGGYFLVAIALCFSVVALYYYLKVLKAVFVSEETGAVGRDSIGWPSTAMIVLLTLLTIVLGIWPELFIHFIRVSLV